MADVKTGTITDWHSLSPILATFRLMPEHGSAFPEYKAGQYIALRRQDCRLTKRIVAPDGQARYVPDLDDNGVQKYGAVTHSYSIASAPFETRERGGLEFYVILEQDEHGQPGRLTESLFRSNVPSDGTLTYVNRIVGDFTLAKRASGSQNVLWVGTGTGVAPFVSMVKQLHYNAAHSHPSDAVRYTLLHTNRTREELAYHEELREIEASGRLDFVYLPSVSRPTARDLQDATLGRGRANNMLRYALDMPLKERDDLDEAEARGDDVSRRRAALERVTTPALPSHISRRQLQDRLEPSRTVILTCGNPDLMADIKHIADALHIQFEKEDW